MRLQSKIHVVVAVAYAVLIAVGAASVPILAERLARERLRLQALLLLDAADATVRYVQGQVTPLLDVKDRAQFLPESVPFYAAAKTVDQMVAGVPNAGFRQPALNPTNKADLPMAWEADMIHAFAAGMPSGEIAVERETQGERVFTVGRPVRVGDQGCLVCHGSPAAAPPSMLDVYGSRDGFGWKLDEIVGAEIVSLPMAGALAEARARLAVAAAVAAGIAAVALLGIDLAAQAILVRPIRRLAAHAEEVSLGSLDSGGFDTATRDELGGLAMSFNRMRRSLVMAMKMLDG